MILFSSNQIYTLNKETADDWAVAVAVSSTYINIHTYTKDVSIGLR